MRCDMKKKNPKYTSFVFFPWRNSYWH